MGRSRDKPDEASAEAARQVQGGSRCPGTTRCCLVTPLILSCPAEPLMVMTMRVVMMLSWSTQLGMSDGGERQREKLEQSLWPNQGSRTP